MSVGITALVVSGATAAAGAVQARKSRKAQRRANDAQRKINRLKNLQSKRQFLRQFRQAQAASLVSGVAAGINLESSRVQGERSSQSAQAAMGVAEFARMDELGAEMSAQLNRASNYQAQAAMYGAASNFAMSFASLGKGTGTEGGGDVKVNPDKGAGQGGFGPI